MTAQREVWYVPLAGGDPDAVKHGIAWLDEVAKRLRSTTAWIIAVSKDSVENGVAAEVLGRENARRFVQGTALTLPSKVRVQLVTMNRLPYRGPGGPVLALHVPPNVLTKLDDMSDIPALCAIPWAAGEYDTWKTKWNARNVFGGTSSVAASMASPVRLTNRVAEEALQSLTGMVNLSTGLAHSRDRSAAVWMFRKLRDAREPVDFDELPAWLVVHQWRSDAAEELTQLGRDIYVGKRRQAGENPWREGIVRIWRQEAKERDA